MTKKRKARRTLTIERVHELLRYDPDSGKLFWRVDIRSGANGNQCHARAGDEAGHKRKDGYISVSVDGYVWKAHRLIWFMVKGVKPRTEVDHWDLNRSNNRWGNLRDPKLFGNRWNKRAKRGTASGMKGVSLMSNGRYIARIQVTLYSGKSPKAAAIAYEKAARALHGAFLNLDPAQGEPVIPSRAKKAKQQNAGPARGMGAGR